MHIHMQTYMWKKKTNSNNLLPLSPPPPPKKNKSFYINKKRKLKKKSSLIRKEKQWRISLTYLRELSREDSNIKKNSLLDERID